VNEQALPQTDFAPIVQAVFDDLDMQQLAALRCLSGAQRLQMAFEMCQSPRERIVASILARNPDISPDELNRQVVECIMMGCTFSC
jgi:hypothetical protein